MIKYDAHYAQFKKINKSSFLQNNLEEEKNIHV